MMVYNRTSLEIRKGQSTEQQSKKHWLSVKSYQDIKGTSKTLYTVWQHNSSLNECLYTECLIHNLT